ncbi:MAG: DNA-directed DNA polymerase I [Sulfolobales archaeon]|nr:DNA-directed DNA polymerase I [Sulfolobales archaeon]MCX8185656.1 DNA-directed DNA polymerase I [Sulfolobales archaeon]MDW7969599.1 DNA-directed DNA polymerase I [Sulfolobales archaeon]
MGRGKYRSLLQYVRECDPVSNDVVKFSFDSVHVKVLRRCSGCVKVVLHSNKYEVVRDVDDSFLLGSYYSGDLGKAYLKFYSDSKDMVYIWYDSLGHKPYFITDLPPDKILSNKGIVSDKSFHGTELVEKVDLLSGKKVVLTKIIVKDPQAVPRLRDLVPKAWEAKIKYHDNYIFDLGLIPGMMYSIHEVKIQQVRLDLSDELLNNVSKYFKDEGPDVLRLAHLMMPIYELRPPKIRRLAIDIEVFTPYRSRVPNPEEPSYPIISIALVSNDGLQKVLVLWRPNVELGSKHDLPDDAVVELFDSEEAMIKELFRVVNDYPLIVTFNGDNFDLYYLMNRALLLGIDADFIPFEMVRDFIGVRHGFHVDLYKFFSIEAIQNYAFEGRYKEKTLDAVAGALIGVSKVEVDTFVSDLPLTKLVEYNFRDAWLTLNLTMFDDELVWKLIILISRLAKMSIEDVTRRKVSAWIKNLMFWEHRQRGYLIPNQEDLLSVKGKVVTAAKIGGKRYAGAIVIDPVPGVYFNVVVADFASLYPSIIKKWNISYETIDPLEKRCTKLYDIKDEKGDTIHKVCVDVAGITSQIVGLLRDFRVKIYKKLSKSPQIRQELKSWYEVVQRAMKVYINASYGVFGHAKFPFYTPSAAESVTAIGRYVISSTIAKAKELGLKVLYGDTDSLFLWNPSEDSLQKLRDWVVSNFGLDLELDKTYKFVAFALKKNYLGLQDGGGIDVKGLMGKKRNVPKILQETFIEVVNALSKLNNTPESMEDVKEFLRLKVHDLYVKLKDRSFTLDEVAYRTTLNKDPSEYVKTTPQHVKAANQLINNGVNITRGDVILYVKVRSKDKVRAIQLAKVDDVDVESYLDYVKSILEQVLIPFSITWDDIAGTVKLETFMR